MRRVLGFTLIEIMMVLVVVAVLVAIAMPSYQSSVRKSRRADARSALLAMQIEQEKMRASCPFFAATLTGTRACGASATATVLSYPTTSPDGYYNVSITAASATGYTMQASGVGDQANDPQCATMTLAVAAGGETKTPADCW